VITERKLFRTVVYNKKPSYRWQNRAMLPQASNEYCIVLYCIVLYCSYVYV